MRKRTPKKKATAEQEIVKRIVKRIKRQVDIDQDNRATFIEDTKFDNGDQWDTEAKTDRDAAGRPVDVVNKVAGTNKSLIGTMRQNDVGIKVRPVDGQADPQTAELLTGLIRNIENTSTAKSAYDCAGASAIRGGFGYFRVITEYSEEGFDQDIKIERIVNPLAVLIGASEKIDRSDAMWASISSTMELDEFKTKYPGKSWTQQIEFDDGDDSGWFTEEGVKVVEFFEVKLVPKNLMLLKGGRVIVEDDISEDDTIEAETADQLRASGLVEKERITKQRKITWYKTSGAEILEGPEDWAGKYIPIIPVWGEEAYVEGKLYLRSATKWAKTPAKIYNWSIANMMETQALNPKQPYIGTEEQFEGHEQEWDNAHRSPKSRLTYKHVDGQAPPQRAIPSLADQGAMTMAQIATEDIKAVTGRYDASLGAPSAETSGIAISNKQSQGDTATYEFTDNLQIAISYCGKVLVDLIPKIYDTDRVVRLLGPDGKEAMQRINYQDPREQTLEEMEKGIKLNDISVGAYDTVATTGPGFLTQRQETIDGLFNVMQSAPHTAAILLPDVVKNMDYPNAEETAEKLEAMNQPGQPSPEEQMKLQEQQLTNQGKMLDNEQTKIKIQGDIAKTEEGIAKVVIKVNKQLGMIPDDK